MFLLFFAPCLYASTLHIVTTFYPLHIMALNVTKGVPHIKLTNLVPPMTGCLHDFALTPQQMRSLSGASILIANGSGMETFLTNVLRQYPQLPLIKLAAGYKNPHRWLSVPLASDMVAHLAKRLGIVDPVHRKAYDENARLYLLRLAELDTWIKKELLPYKGTDIITFHEAFPYFALEYGFNVIGVVEKEPGSPLSAKEIIALRSLQKSTGAKMIFAELQYPAEMASVLKLGSHTRIARLDTAVTGPAQLDAYIKAMEYNVAAIKGAL